MTVSILARVGHIAGTPRVAQPSTCSGSAGDKNLHYLAGDGLIGDDGEGTVDGSHPTDLGFMRQADAFAEALRPLLAPKN